MVKLYHEYVGFGEKYLPNIHFYGIVHKIHPIKTIRSRYGNIKMKRVIVLCDDTGYYIHATFWSELAIKFDRTDIKVVFLKNIRVSQWSILTFNHVEESEVDFNPQNDRAFQLVQWYHENNIGGPDNKQFAESIAPNNGIPDGDLMPVTHAATHYSYKKL